MAFILIGVILLLLIFKLLRKKSNVLDNSSLIEESEIATSLPIPIQASKPKTKSAKTWGKFDVVGYHYLSEEVKKRVWKELKVGDQLSLIPDPSNPYDSKAIKVMFKEAQIGWFPKAHFRKKEIFDSLISKKEFNVVCTENLRRAEAIRAGRPESNGKFVEGKYEYNR